MNRAIWFNVSPEGAKAIGTLHHFVTQGTGLPSLLTHLVFLRVSQINGCAHCIDIHTRDVIKEGMSVDTVVLVPVWPEAEYLFSAQERAALAWAEEVTRVSETHASDEAYATCWPKACRWRRWCWSLCGMRRRICSLRRSALRWPGPRR